jgi:hypothetical protein
MPTSFWAIDCADWAIDCAERVLPFFEQQFPNDYRSRHAIKVLQYGIRPGSSRGRVFARRRSTRMPPREMLELIRLRARLPVLPGKPSHHACIASVYGPTISA